MERHSASEGQCRLNPEALTVKEPVMRANTLFYLHEAKVSWGPREVAKQVRIPTTKPDNQCLIS